MPQQKHKPEETVVKLRRADVLVARDRTVAETVRSLGVTQFTDCRGRKEFGGPKTDQLNRLKEKDRAIDAPWVQAQGRGSVSGRRSLT